MTAAVFDSSVIVTLVLQESGWQPIQRVLANPDVDAILPGPVLTEAISVARRKGNQSTGEQIWEALSAFGARVEHPTEEDLIRAAELIEMSEDNPGPPNPRNGKEATLSLGDALIIAIAERLGHLVLTRDEYWKWMVDEDLLDLNVHIP